jgi:uncharacterized protein HemY
MDTWHRLNRKQLKAIFRAHRLVDSGRYKQAILLMTRIADITKSRALALVRESRAMKKEKAAC